MTGILLETVIAMILLCLTGVAIPWIKTKTSAAQQDTVNRILDVLVRASEQIYGFDGDGDAKLALVKDWLIDRGLDVPVSDIEAAVYRMKMR